MRIGGIVVSALALCTLAAAAQAGLPRPVSMVERVATSQSRGAYGFRSGKYSKAAWGNRWNQSLGRAPVVVSPYVRGY
jgi:hypothetical protein